MILPRSRANYLRVRDEKEPARVTFIELFFDLVFVFAITQLSHGLLHHFNATGMAQTALLMMAVWWVWIYTSWFTNWIDPEHTPVRLVLLVLMLAGLILSTSLPAAFQERGLAFAGTYVFMQVARSLFTMWLLKPHAPGHYRNFQRITSWLVLSGVLWIAGGFLHDEQRFAMWALALLIEYISPSLGFWAPGLGRSTTHEWDVDGHHFAERCALFIIIALGESVLVTGATFADLDRTTQTVGAFISAFVGSIAMWWLYFDIGAESGTKVIEESKDPGRLARLAYTYMHLPIVAGIIVAAVGDELVLAHPDGALDTKTEIALFAGPALYLIGNFLFKRTITGRPILSHIVGIVLLMLLIPLSGAFTPLILTIATTAVLVIVAFWERLSLRSLHSYQTTRKGTTRCIR
jgi:low temperature requirement protein LtrA